MFHGVKPLAIVAICATSAAAQPVHSGPQAAPPAAHDEPVLTQELDARKNVRGCAVGDTCTRPSQLLREFELEAFPKPSQSPWLDERTPPGSHLEAKAPHHVTRPSELRPDAPWLDKLEMPDLPVTWSQRLP